MCFSWFSQEEFDTHNPKAHHFLKLPFLKKRSRIVEIGVARDTMFALTHSGICAAFSRGTEINSVVLRPYLLDVLLSAFFETYNLVLDVPNTNKRICFLNISADEVIRSLFYNKNNDSLITVSVYASDNFSSLKCRTTPIEYVLSFLPS
jgi:hypothetical protein